MWFSPVKGAYMTLGQIDKTARVVSTAGVSDGAYGDAKLIKRGMFLKLNSDGNFEPYPNASDSTAGAPYIALQNYTDYQAGAAGSGSEAWENQNVTGSAASGVKGDAYGLAATQAPAITGLSTLMAGEYQTTAFLQSGTYTVGTPLTIKDGLLAPISESVTGNVVGYVTAGKGERWINDLKSDDPAAHFTGGKADVIQWTTHFFGVDSGEE